MNSSILTASEEIRRGIEAYQQSDVVKRCENILNGSKKPAWQAVKESLAVQCAVFFITGLSVLLYLGGVAVF